MNIVLIYNGRICNMPGITSVEPFKLLEYIKFYRDSSDYYICNVGETLCFNHKRYLLSKENMDEVVNQLRFHQHNSDIRDALAKLK